MGKLYISFMLRLWQSNDADPATWRASLEDPHTHQVIVFTSLEKLNQYLSDQTSAVIFTQEKKTSATFIGGV